MKRVSLYRIEERLVTKNATSYRRNAQDFQSRFIKLNNELLTRSVQS